METTFIICFACLFLIPGILLALLNWADICIWVWEKWRHHRSKAETCIVPFLGGLLLTSGIAILTYGLHEYSVPFLKTVVGYGMPGMVMVVALALAGFLIDYGSIPNLIITPLLGFLFRLRGKPAPSGSPAAPTVGNCNFLFP
ncbi:MAG: hypothetical protein IJ498_01980 [Akkermansia sp.]|nr:hypothetical protein [Akkermansia sp.]